MIAGCRTLAYAPHFIITQVATYNPKHPDPPKLGEHGGTAPTIGGL